MRIYEGVQRRLWFDYITKLNDRDLQSSRASGFTPWVLLAVAAAIVYKCVPQIPTILSVPGAPKLTLAVLSLELDALFFMVFSLAALVQGCQPGHPSRLVPEQKERSNQVIVVILRGVLIAVVVAHFRAAVLIEGFPVVRRVLVLFGLYWSLEIVRGISSSLNAWRQAQKNRSPSVELSLPKSTWMTFSFGGAVFFLLSAAIPSFTLFFFVRSLQRVGLPWLLSLAAATNTLALVLVLLALLWTLLESASRGIFLELERDIVVEALPVSEIRTRFVREAIGASLDDWLQALIKKRQETVSRVAELTQSLGSRVQEIEAIDPTFEIERAGRAQKLLAELQSAFKPCTDELTAIYYQVSQMAAANPKTWESGMLGRLVDQWATENKDCTGALAAVGELTKRVNALVSVPKRRSA